MQFIGHVFRRSIFFLPSSPQTVSAFESGLSWRYICVMFIPEQFIWSVAPEMRKNLPRYFVSFLYLHEFVIYRLYASLWKFESEAYFLFFWQVFSKLVTLTFALSAHSKDFRTSPKTFFHVICDINHVDYRSVWTYVIGIPFKISSYGCWLSVDMVFEGKTPVKTRCLMNAFPPTI